MGAPNAATIERFAYSALKPQVSRQIQLYSLLILAFRPVRHRFFPTLPRSLALPNCHQCSDALLDCINNHPNL